MDHPCTQKETISQMSRSIDANTRTIDMQSRALFGNPMVGESGLIDEIKEINRNIKQMMPVYQDVNNWTTFFKKGRQLGGWLVALALGSGVLIGAAYAVRDWFKH